MTPKWKSGTDGLGSFTLQLYDFILQIPVGQVTTYGIIAKHIGSSPQAGKSSDPSRREGRSQLMLHSNLVPVGGALRDNAFQPYIPCHRVIATNRMLGGFQGEWDKTGLGGKANQKLHLLRSEGVQFDALGCLIGDKIWSGVASV